MPWEPHLLDTIPAAAEGDLLKAAKRRKAEERITNKWISLGGAPGESTGDLIEIGIGFYRQYVHGRIYYNYHYGSKAFHVYGAIGDRYTQLQGPGSWLGWPTSDEQAFSGDGRVSTFEHGAIYWWPDTGAIELGNISVQYKGLYCFGETDEMSDSDEPYAIFGVVPALPAQPFSFRTRTYEEKGGVDAGNSRPDYMQLYQGLPYGMALGIVLMEHDEGDPDKYLGQVKQGVSAAGELISLACGAFGGPKVAKTCEEIWEKIAPEIVKFVNNLLGTDDDIIERWVWKITPKEMVVMTRTPPKTFWGIDYHLESKLLSDGEASYKMYLAIHAV